jgi:hypothetical protein
MLHGAGKLTPTKPGDFLKGQMLGFIFQHHGELIWDILVPLNPFIIPHKFLAVGGQETAPN